MPEADVVSQEDLQRRYDRLHVVYQLTSALSQSLALGEIYNEALHALEAGINARRASILLFDDDGVMRFKAWRGLSDGYRAAVEGHSPWQRDDRSPQPILVPDVTAEPSLADFQPAIVAEGIRAVGFIPLVAEERLLGKFMVYYGEPHDFTNEERRLIQNIAQHIALAILRKFRDERITQLNSELIQRVGDYERAVVALERSEAELRQKVEDLERFEEVVIGRELKMIQLEKELYEVRKTPRPST